MTQTASLPMPPVKCGMIARIVPPVGDAECLPVMLDSLLLVVVLAAGSLLLLRYEEDRLPVAPAILSWVLAGYMTVSRLSGSVFFRRSAVGNIWAMAILAAAAVILQLRDERRYAAAALGLLTVIGLLIPLLHTASM